MNNESQNSIISENTEMIGSVNVKVELQNSDIQTVTPKLQKKVYRQLIQTAVLKVLGNPVDRTNLPMDVELSKLYVHISFIGFLRKTKFLRSQNFQICIQIVLCTDF